MCSEDSKVGVGSFLVGSWHYPDAGLYSYMCPVCQQRGGREDLYLIWPEVPSESTWALILVPATGLNGDGRWCHKLHSGWVYSQVSDLGSPVS